MICNEFTRNVFLLVTIHPAVPILAILTSFYLTLNLPAVTWVRFVVWLVIGFAIYFLYGARHSRLATDPNYSLEADVSARDEREADAAARDEREARAG